MNKSEIIVVKDSVTFVNEILTENNDLYMASFDIYDLFTNITLDIILFTNITNY